MTNFLLVRHAVHALGGETIAGRAAGVHLSDAGRDQANELAGRLAGVRLDAIYGSPLERTTETLQPLALRHGLEPRVSEALLEIDYGEWTGRRLDELRDVARWKQWNAFRSGTRVPHGETMLAIQSRVVAEMQRLWELHPQHNVALVSHGDVIKAAVAYFLGVPLDLFQRIEISPASVSVVQLAEYGPWVACVNSTSTIGELPVF